MAYLPTVFVSHGSPMLAVEDSPTRRFLAGFAADLPRPQSILTVSAHWLTRAPAVSAAEWPETIHDFGGFPEALYRLRYPAPGAPQLAARAAGLFGQAGLDCVVDPRRGLDHGAWVPLMLMYPDADIPVTQLALQPERGPAHHEQLGGALRPLRGEGVLILATGSLTHNLREAFGSPPGSPPPAWAAGFAHWFEEATRAGRRDELLTYRERAPEAVRNHPTDEHLLPFFVALGAATPGVPGRRVHAAFEYGSLAMDAYRFD